MTKAEIMKRADRLMREYPELDDVRIRVSARMTRSAGCVRVKARHGHVYYRELVLSYPVFVNPDNEHDLDDTILHEMAHLIVGHGHGHDIVWYEKCREIGCSGAVYHDLDIPARHTRPVRCEKCGSILQIGIVRYNRILRGEREYRHKADHGILEVIERSDR